MARATAIPPYNIEKTGDGEYRIQMALAGFTRDEIDVTVQDNMLIIIGRANEAETDQPKFLHRGIAKRAFERRFQLADTIKVIKAGYDNGLLNVELVRENPRAQEAAPHRHRRHRTCGRDRSGAKQSCRLTITHPIRSVRKPGLDKRPGFQSFWTLTSRL